MWEMKTEEQNRKIYKEAQNRQTREDKLLKGRRKTRMSEYISADE